MKLYLHKFISSPNESFQIRRDTITQNARWHYHEELEMLYIKRGKGTQIVGNTIREIGAGEFYLLGSNLPHYWQFDLLTDEGGMEVIVIHFREDFLGSSFFAAPELADLQSMITRAKTGLRYRTQYPKGMGLLFENLLEAKGTERICMLLQLLTRFAENAEELLSLNYTPNFKQSDSERINAIFEHTMSNFREKLVLDDVSRQANMNPHSFCRYFKAKTGKTYTEFVSELRIGYACRQLIESEKTMNIICYESGFNNTTSFHQTFKKITGCSPGLYRKQVQSGMREAF